MNVILGLVLFCSAWLVESRVISSPREPRLSLAEPMPSYYYTNIDGVPGTYSFGYDVNDEVTGNTQFRTEERYPNGTVVGSYGYIDAAGKPMRYRYVADERGYRVMRVRPQTTVNTYRPPTDNNIPIYTKTEDSVTWSRKKLNSNQKYSVSSVLKSSPSTANIYYPNRNQMPLYS